MNVVRAFLLACLLAGCASSPTVQQYAGPLGKIQRSDLDDTFMAGYNSYTVQADFVDLIRRASPGVRIVVFLGTWCSDSRREVPHFLKIIDQAGFPAARLTLYAVDREKKCPDGSAAQYGIERVPTIVFEKGSEEVGRIVETPRTTLEGDVLTILAQAQQQ
jgi:hypothetical protein